MGEGDVNPVPVILMVIAIKAFLALLYSGITVYTSASLTLASWLALYVFTVLPDVPVVVNVLLSVGLNGTLITYLVLLIKRIINPLSN